MDIRDLINPLGGHFLRINWVKEGVWVPTFGGFSADPAGVIARYVLRGTRCRVDVMMPNDGTSNANFLNVSAPFPAAVVAGMSWGAVWWTGVDNGAVLTAPGRVYINSGQTLFNLNKDIGVGTWTTSGGKRAHFGLEYEIG